MNLSWPTTYLGEMLFRGQYTTANIDTRPRPAYSLMQWPLSPVSAAITVCYVTVNTQVMSNPEQRVSSDTHQW